MHKGQWLVGMTAGVALGLGAVVAVQGATGEASAAHPVTVSAQQLTINQRISQAAVKRANEANATLAALAPQIPLFAVSSGVVGSNLVRTRGAVSSQRIDDGNYRVKFDRNISACSWTGTASADAPPVSDVVTLRIALDTTDAARTQLVVRTANLAGTAVNSPFHIQVVC
jgi:hypothetical protein